MSQATDELPDYVIKKLVGDTYHRRLNQNSLQPACVARLHNVDEDTSWVLANTERVTDHDQLCGNPECFG